MLSRFVKSATWPLVLLLLGVNHLRAQAEVYVVTELQQPVTTSPTMTGFYNVSPDGDTTLMDPVKSGFAINASSGSHPQQSAEGKRKTAPPEPVNRKASRRKVNNTKSRTIRIRARHTRPERDLANQFQCERHGFYYTRDDRCILPGYHYDLPVPKPLPNHRIRTKMPD